MQGQHDHWTTFKLFESNFLSISWPTRTLLFKNCQNCVFYYKAGTSKQGELHAFLFNISRVLRLYDNLYLAVLSDRWIAPEL